MAWQVRVFAAKPDDVTQVPGPIGGSGMLTPHVVL